MNRILLGILLVCGVGVLAIGPNPRYLEELRIGGGFADPVDGGVDLDKAGNIVTDGSITVEGDLAVGKNEAVDHSISVISGPTNDTQINLYDQDSNNGGVIWFDGDQDTLRIGTRSASSVPTDALEIAKGSANVKVLGDLDLTGDLTVQTNTLFVDSASGDIGMGITPVQKVHIYEPTTGSVRIRLQNDEGFGDIATDDNKIVFFGSDGAARFRVEQFVNKSFQRIVPNVDSTWDFGGVGERWAKLWAVTGDFSGDVDVFGGDLDVGSDSATRGVVTAWDGGDGASPGVLRLASRNGTTYYFFAEDSGTLRVHTALPTLNSDGTSLGGAGVPVDDTTSIVRDPADNTKTVRIDAGAISSGVTRTIFMGDRDVDLATSGTFQDRDSELSDVAGMTPTKGLLIVGDGTQFVSVGVGTNNQVLTANSAVSAGINWGASGGGGETHPVDDSTTLVRDPVDNTKLMRVDVGAVATATTRVLTMPDQDIDLTPDTGSFAKAGDHFVTIYLSNQTGTDLAVGTAVVTWRTPFAMTVTDIKAGLKGSSSSGLPTFDINESGTSVLSTKLTIDASETTSETAATAEVISDTSWAADAEMTFDIDVAGTGADGAFITILYDRT